MASWDTVLDCLVKGNSTILKKMTCQKRAFRWYTSAITFNPIGKPTFEGHFREECEVESKLHHLKQDFTSFQDYLKEPMHRYATCFLNPVKDCLLVIPVPIRQGKGYRDFSSIYQFHRNASKTQQEAFWKFAAHHMKCMAKSYSRIWVNAHGLGVPYFHLRIDVQPKYYSKSILPIFNKTL